ncbi:hypothetical protein L1887_57022 [Cichorium endivia]|nr:hypothetical protein L1887_57022 [Cichorium endivia]
MPPLPLHDSYPPSGSGYRPLATGDDDYEEQAPPPDTSRLRTFVVSPYQSPANDPSQILRAFLTDTRTPGEAHATKNVALRVRFRSRGTETTVDLPVSSLTEQDALPFALADDVPCRRGIMRRRAWNQRLRGMVDHLAGRSSTSSKQMAQEQDELSVWDRTQGKSLPASDEAKQRYHRRLETGLVPPWIPLDEDSGSLSQLQAAQEAENDGNADDKLDLTKLFTGSGDVDLGIFFRRSRRRRATRLVSVALQEALERFADDRHFSKRLVCRNTAWGWDLPRLKESLRSLAAHAAEGKGKAPAHAADEAGGADVDIDVVGMEEGPVYHVVWAPIALLAARCPGLVESRVSAISLALLATFLVAATLLGALSGILILAIMVVVGAWSTMMWLVATKDECVYDGIGTAWSLAPRWQTIDADPSWDMQRARASLPPDSAGDQVQLERRGNAWCVRRGIDQDEWVALHRDRIQHALTART